MMTLWPAPAPATAAAAGPSVSSPGSGSAGSSSSSLRSISGSMFFFCMPHHRAIALLLETAGANGRRAEVLAAIDRNGDAGDAPRRRQKQHGIGDFLRPRTVAERHRGAIARKGFGILPRA